MQGLNFSSVQARAGDLAGTMSVALPDVIQLRLNFAANPSHSANRRRGGAGQRRTIGISGPWRPSSRRSARAT